MAKKQSRVSGVGSVRDGALLMKDLQTLRHYGILGDLVYRWGYYLGSSTMTEVEFNTALSEGIPKPKRSFRPKSRGSVDADETEQIRALKVSLWQTSKADPSVVVGQNLAVSPASAGQFLGAPLAHANAMPKLGIGADIR
jgi:hypothetical protein